MSWLLLAVFVALAGTTAALWRAQVKRQNEQAFAAQAASIGASVTTAVRRMDDLTLAARTMLGSRPDTTSAEFAGWYRSMGVEQRFSGVAGFGYVEITRQSPRDVYPPGRRAYYCLSRLAIAGPGMEDTLGELTAPGLDLCQLTNVLDETRDSGEFSAIVVTSSAGHEMFEVVAPTYRGGAVPRSVEARRRLATGWVIGLFDAEPILRAAIGRQADVAVSLQRDHVESPEYRIPTGGGSSLRTLTQTTQAPSVARYGAVHAKDLIRRRMSVQADGRWNVTVTGAEPRGLSDPEVQASLVLLVWLALGALAFVLVQVLARGRA